MKRLSLLLLTEDGSARADHHKQVELARAIIQKLLRNRDEPSFVVFHMDGDRPFADSKNGQEAQLLAHFDERLRPRIEAGLKAQEQPALLDHLLILMPFYSIEAWLYQNTRELQRIYEERFAPGHRDLQRINGWHADPGSLDEIRKPKDELAIGADHNARLATQGFPAQRAFDVGKSFAVAVMRALECAPLMRALEDLRRSGSRPAGSQA